MKNRFLFLSLIAVLVLTSCQNFLTSSELKEAIEKEILIANSNIPEILSAEPKLIDGGVYSDSNIIVSFSKPMDSKYLSDFSNITITDSNGTNLANHYLSPVLSSDGRTLTVAHDPSNYITVEEGSLKTVKVTLSKNIQDTETIPLKNDYTWTYNINSKKDDKAPEFLSGTTLKGSSAPMQEGTFANLITTLGADNFFTDTYHVNSVNIDLKSSDSGSGVAKLIVKEKLLYSVEGVDVASQNIAIETEYTNIEKENYIYSFSGKHELSKSFPDGIIEIDLVIIDKCGNSSSKTYSVIKDTSVQVTYTKTFADYANPDVTPIESNHYYLINDYQTENYWAKWNGVKYTDTAAIEKVTLCYEDGTEISNGNLVSNTSGNLYYFDKIDTEKDCIILTTFVDQIGNKKDYSVSVLKAPVLLDVFSTDPECLILTYSDFGKIISYCGNSNTDLTQFSNTTEADGYSQSFHVSPNKYVCMRIDYSDTSRPEYSIKDTFNYFSKLVYVQKEFDCKEWDNTNDFSCSISMGTKDSDNGCYIDFKINNTELLTSDTLVMTTSFDGGNYFTKSYLLEKKECNTVFIPLSDLWQLNNGSQIMYIGLQTIKDGIKTESAIDYDVNPPNAKTEQWYSINIKEVIKSYYQSNDVIPPTMNGGIFYYQADNTNKYPYIDCTIHDKYWDDYRSLLNANGKIPIKIYYGKITERDLSLNEIKLLNSYSYELTPKNSNASQDVDVPLTDFLNDVKNEVSQNYDLYIYFEDNSGNSVYKKIVYRYNKDTTYTPVYNSEKHISDIEFSTGNTLTHLSDYDSPLINDAKTSVSIELTPYPENTFVFYDMNVKKYEDDTHYYEYTFPYYVYTTKTDCNTKNILQNGKLLTVIHDQPAFVHTVASPINFGEDIRAWEDWIDVDFKLNGTTFNADGTSLKFDNYTYPSASDIPTGWYYAAIIYFADNTSTIGTVFQN